MLPIAPQRGKLLAAGAGAVGDSLGIGPPDDADMMLTRLVHMPAHDGEARAGVSMRALDGVCFGAARASRWMGSAASVATKGR